MNITRSLRYLLAFLVSLSFYIVQAQESNNGKQLWAKSILNKKAPKLQVKEWISDEPDTEGKFILVDFWATWCGPCVRLIPKLNQWHEKHRDKLVIIGISDEPAETVRNYNNVQISYYNAIDTQARLKNKLAVTGIPHCILLDPQGIVRWEGFPTLSGHELTEEVLEDIIKKYEQKNPGE